MRYTIVKMKAESTRALRNVSIVKDNVLANRTGGGWIGRLAMSTGVEKRKGWVKCSVARQAWDTNARLNQQRVFVEKQENPKRCEDEESVNLGF